MPVTLTRLHVRYSADTFPEDLIFQETQDQENFQARYVMHHAWDGSPDACEAAKNYFDDLNKRRAQEAETLADLTGWNLEDVIKKAGLPPESQPKPWWQEHLGLVRHADDVAARGVASRPRARVDRVLTSHCPRTRSTNADPQAEDGLRIQTAR